LGERFNGIEEVVGSIPSGSTNNIKRFSCQISVAHLPRDFQSRHHVEFLHSKWDRQIVALTVAHAPTRSRHGWLWNAHVTGAGRSTTAYTAALRHCLLARAVPVCAIQPSRYPIHNVFAKCRACGAYERHLELVGLYPMVRRKHPSWSSLQPFFTLLRIPGVDFRLRALCGFNLKFASPGFNRGGSYRGRPLRNGLNASGENLAPELEVGQLLRTFDQAAQERRNGAKRIGSRNRPGAHAGDPDRRRA
jgi:hypothetical protein